MTPQSQSENGVTPIVTLTGEPIQDDKFRILSLDGGGAKGFYTLGVLKEIEALLGFPCISDSIWFLVRVPAQ